MSGTDERFLPDEGREGHSLAQRRRLAALSLEEKLAWLEEAHALVIELERARRARTKEKPQT